MLALHVLASGSKGNAAVVENLDSGEGILVDCGICKRDFMSRCGEAGFDVSKLKAILITHDHSDHVGKLGVVMRGLRGGDFCMYALDAVVDGCKHVSDASEMCEVNRMRCGDSISIAGISVSVFETSHDALASCGFRFDSEDSDSIGFMTDTGYVTDAAMEALSGVRILALESNHDVDMLEHGEYPFYLKQRVGSDKGHLSNAQASDALRVLSHDGLEHVIAMHISHNNNLPSLVRDVFESTLQEISSPATLHVSSQFRLVSIS